MTAFNIFYLTSYFHFFQFYNDVHKFQHPIHKEMLSGKYWFVIPFARAYQAKHLRDYPYFMSLQCLCMVTFGPTPSLVVTFWPLFGSPLPWKKIDMIYGPPLYSKGTKISLFAPFWAFIWKGILWWPIDVEIFFCCPHSVFDKNTKPLFFIRTLWIRGTTTTSKFTDWRAKKKLVRRWYLAQ